MRVLYVSRSYTTHDRRFLSVLAGRHEVSFLRCEEEGPSYEARPFPAGVRDVPWGRRSAGTAGPLDALAAAPAFARVIEVVRPDLVQAGPVQTWGFMVALQDRKPLVLMSWGRDLLVDSDRDELWRWTTAYSLSRCALLVCDSVAVRERARSFGLVDDERVLTFPWGIDLTAFAPGADGAHVRARYGWEDALIVISTRSLEPIYGVDAVIDAFRLARVREPRLRLLLLGDGNLRAEVAAAISAAGLDSSVAQVGAVPNELLPDHFRAADVYVSGSRTDGSSVSLLEAMATGLPVVVSDVPGNREWVRHGVNGWLVPVGDVSALADRMLEAARLGRDARVGMADANRSAMEARADQSVTFRALVDAYERIERRLPAASPS